MCELAAKDKIFRNACFKIREETTLKSDKIFLIDAGGKVNFPFPAPPSNPRRVMPFFQIAGVSPA
jgi:hypothetical protein